MVPLISAGQRDVGRVPIWSGADIAYRGSPPARTVFLFLADRTALAHRSGRHWREEVFEPVPVSVLDF